MKANRKIAVLGDMFDLGEKSDEIHLNLAEVFEILKYMDKTDVMKIPVEILTKIKDYKSR